VYYCWPVSTKAFQAQDSQLTFAPICNLVQCPVHSLACTPRFSAAPVPHPSPAPFYTAARTVGPSAPAPQAQACSTAAAVVGLGQHTRRLASRCREMRKMPIFWYPHPRPLPPTFFHLKPFTRHPGATLKIWRQSPYTRCQVVRGQTDTQLTKTAQFEKKKTTQCVGPERSGSVNNLSAGKQSEKEDTQYSKQIDHF